MLAKFILMSLLSVHLPVWGASTASAGMSFGGTLVSEPSCIIQDGERIDVNFGSNIASSKVDGVNYMQPLNYTITCQGGTSGAVVMLSLFGEPSPFDANAIKTSIPNNELGIRVYQSGATLTLFKLNSAIKIDPAAPPKLQVVPVKKLGAKLPARVFEAWATLQADYQ